MKNDNLEEILIKNKLLPEKRHKIFRAQQPIAPRKPRENIEKYTPVVDTYKNLDGHIEIPKDATHIYIDSLDEYPVISFCKKEIYKNEDYEKELQEYKDKIKNYNYLNRLCKKYNKSLDEESKRQQRKHLESMYQHLKKKLGYE